MMQLGLYSEALTGGVLYKKVFLLEISQNSHENSCTRAPFVIKLGDCFFISNSCVSESSAFMEDFITDIFQKFSIDKIVMNI